MPHPGTSASIRVASGGQPTRSALRNLSPPREYALVWRATLSAAGLFAQLGATVPTRGFHLAYSPGFRGSIPPARPQPAGGTLRRAS